MKNDNGNERFRLSIDTRLLAERLAKMTKGEAVAWTEFSEIVGADVRAGRARSSLSSARIIAERDHGVVVRAVPTLGLARLKDVEIVTRSPDEFRRAIGRKATRTASELATVEFSALSPEDQTRHNAALSMAGAIKLGTSPAARRRLEKACAAGELSAAKTLALFTGQKEE